MREGGVKAALSYVPQSSVLADLFYTVSFHIKVCRSDSTATFLF